MSWVWGGSPTHTLSPAVKSHLSPLLGFEEYVTVVGWTSRWLAGQFFPSASYPRSSLGMSHRFISFTTGSRWPNRACLVLCWCPFPYPGPKTSHRATQSRVSFFAPKTSLPLPLKGEGLAIVFLGFAEFALLVYNRLTRLQQGPFGASLVSFYYSAFKTAHRATWG